MSLIRLLILCLIVLPATAGAAYFTDDQSREPLPALRERAEAQPETLTELDRAILRAANRVGWLEWHGCKRRGGNAFLVRVDGRDAVLTSAHQIIDGKRQKAWPTCRQNGEASARFYPNMSYLDLGETFRNRARDARYSVGAVLDRRLSGPNASYRFRVPNDYLLYFLESDISDQTAPDGQTRGVIPVSSMPRGEEMAGFILGFDPRFNKGHGGRVMSYQPCRFLVLNPLLLDHTCDAGNGSSSSLLAVYEDGELRLRGLNTAVRLPLGSTAEPAPDGTNWNVGTPVENLLSHWALRGISMD